VSAAPRQFEHEATVLIMMHRDPQRTRTDAELISALQRAYLLPVGEPDPIAEAKFGLDAAVGNGGN